MNVSKVSSNLDKLVPTENANIFTLVERQESVSWVGSEAFQLQFYRRADQFKPNSSQRQVATWVNMSGKE